MISNLGVFTFVREMSDSNFVKPLLALVGKAKENLIAKSYLTVEKDFSLCFYPMKDAHHVIQLVRIFLVFYMNFCSG